MSNITVTTSLNTTWSLEPWPTDRSVDHLVFTDMFAVPEPEDFLDAAKRSARRGARAVRTSALFPRSQANADAAGFVAVDHLHLLKLQLADRTPSVATESDATDVDGAARPSPAARWRRRGATSHTAPLRMWHLGSASDIDRASFGPVWGNSANSLQSILGATEQSRARIVRRSTPARSHVDGFAISGVTDHMGYIQRIAVRPEARRHGLAHTLVSDALDWMKRQGVASVFVNTGTDNQAALALYRSFGFEHTGETLTIHERVHPPRGR